MREALSALSLGLILIGSVEGCDAEVPEQPPVAVVELRRFGGPEELLQKERYDRADTSAPTYLSGVSGVVRTPDSTLMVLNRDGTKLVGFAPNGRVRFLGNDLWEGPDLQTLRAPGLLLSSEGDVRVYLRMGGHFLIMDLDGRQIADVPHPRADLLGAPLISGDTLWIAGNPSRDFLPPVALSISRPGEVLLTGPEDQRGGDPSNDLWLHLARSRAGQLAVTSFWPGLWAEFNGTEWVRKGEPLFPDSWPFRGQLHDDPEEVRVSGFGFIGERYVGQVFFRSPLRDAVVDPVPQTGMRYFLAVFERDGTHLGDAFLGQYPDINWLPAVYFDPFSGHLFVEMNGFRSGAGSVVAEYEVMVKP